MSEPISGVVLSEGLIRELNGLMARTHAKRGALTSDMAALGVITEEYHEVVEAMRRGEPWKVRAELLDLANGAMRRVVAMDAEKGMAREGLSTEALPTEALPTEVHGTARKEGEGVVTLWQIEAVAKELYGIRWLVDWESQSEPAKESFRVDLRAAFEAAGFTVVEGLPTEEHGNSRKEGV